MSQPNIVKPDNLDVQKITILDKDDFLSIRYDNKPFYFATGLLDSPIGLDNNSVIQCLVSDKLLDSFKKLEKYIQNSGTDNIPLETIDLRFGKSTKVFTKDREVIENPYQVLGCRFIANYLLLFSGLSKVDNTWIIEIVQIRVSQIYKLPKGCDISERL